MFAAVGAEGEGANINGPSLIRIPDWILPSERADPSAVYYLYFAHHAGDYIRMAWATDVAGPWTLYQTGSDVPLGDRGVLDNELYSLDNSGFPRRALDPDNPWEPTADYYSGSTIPSLWERHPNQVLQDPISDLGIPRSVLRVRHTAVRVVGDELQVFYTERGGSPERVLLSTIDLGVDDWRDWRLTNRNGS